MLREEEKIQWPIYYMSKSLLDVETRYSKLEKLAFSLMVASRKLRSYFHAHPTEVNQLPTASSTTKARSFRHAPLVGDRVEAV